MSKIEFGELVVSMENNIFIRMHTGSGGLQHVGYFCIDDVETIQYEGAQLTIASNPFEVYYVSPTEGDWSVLKGLLEAAGVVFVG